MKRLILIFVLLPLLAIGQKDSIALVNAAWKVDTLQQGLVLKTVTVNKLFGARQRIALLEIPASSPLRLAFSYEPMRATTSKQARKHAAVAAVNGSFFDMEKHNPICFLRIRGKQLGENTPGQDTVNRKYYQYGTLVLKHGKPIILRTQSSRHWEEQLPYQDIMTAGPLLLYKGVAESIRQDRTFVADRHNRTAIGITREGTVILFAVDGRTKESAGMSLNELTSTLTWLGCYDALNLDGGGSTTLWVRDRVVNYPTDNGRFDHEGERRVSNCILIMSK